MLQIGLAGRAVMTKTPEDTQDMDDALKRLEGAIDRLEGRLAEARAHADAAVVEMTAIVEQTPKDLAAAREFLRIAGINIFDVLEEIFESLPAETPANVN